MGVGASVLLLVNDCIGASGPQTCRPYCYAGSWGLSQPCSPIGLEALGLKSPGSAFAAAQPCGPGISICLLDLLSWNPMV